MSLLWLTRVYRSSFIGLFFAIVLAALVAAGQAAVSSATGLEELREVMRQLHRQYPQARLTVDPATGLMRSRLHLSGRAPGPPTDAEGPEAFLTGYRALLMADRVPEELVLTDVQQFPNSRHLRYQQLYRGLPVWGGQLALHGDGQGRLRMAQGSIRPGIRIDTTPRLDPAAALREARRAVGDGVLRCESRVVLVILPLADGERLAYRVDLATMAPADWRVVIDAISGAVLRKTDELVYEAGEGLVVGENLLTTPETVARPFVDLQHGGILRGDFVDVWSSDKVLQWKRLSKAMDYRFLAPPTDPRFDEQMLYYHVSRAHAYFRHTFGFTGRDHSLKVRAHLAGWNNAAYSLADDLLMFGDGTGAAAGGLNPTSRDADVIVHEYTHAVVRKIVELRGVANDLGDALNEAYADYFACALNDDPEQGEYAMGKAEGMRTLANAHRYPEHLNEPRLRRPEAHWTGLIWAGACWDLRQKLGAIVADQLIFRSLYYLPANGGADFETAALAVWEADAMIYGGAHQEVILQVMNQRGIRPPTPPLSASPPKRGRDPSVAAEAGPGQWGGRWTREEG